jgi:23S rRNA (uridine2552-2'-O)-methyltransferase
MNTKLSITSHGEDNKNLKKNKNRKLSSTIWLDRHIKDPYVINAKKNGYKSRAAFKLLEINEKFNIFDKKNLVNSYIIDLGSAPGSWLQVISKLQPQASIIGLDLQEINDTLPPNVKFFRGDFQDYNFLQVLYNYIAGQNNLSSLTATQITAPYPSAIQKSEWLFASLIVSDMAPATCGDKKADHLRISQLARDALNFAAIHLCPEGNFVVKMFQGEKNNEIFNLAKTMFKKITWFKPKSSYADSKEIFLVAMHKKADF